MVIPGEAPSSGLRRTGVLATGTPRRVAARGACDALRRSPVEVFFARRVMAVVFFDRWRVFPATAFCVDITSLVDGSSETTRKIMLPWGSGSGAVFSSFFNYIAHFSQKSKPYGTAKGRFQSFPDYIFVTAVNEDSPPAQRKAGTRDKDVEADTAFFSRRFRLWARNT